MEQRGGGFKSPTLLKTCENTREIRECRRPQDWALLALQNIRSGKSQYLVICHCLRGELGKSNPTLFIFNNILQRYPITLSSNIPQPQPAHSTNRYKRVGRQNKRKYPIAGPVTNQ